MRPDLSPLLNLSLLRGLAWGLAAGILLTLATQCEWSRRADGAVDGELRQLAHVTDAAIGRQHAAALVVRQRTAAVAAAHRASQAALDRAATLHRLVQIASPTTLRVHLAPIGAIGATGASPVRDTLLTVPPVVVARLVADSLAIDSLGREIRQHEALELAYTVAESADHRTIAAEAEQIAVLTRSKRPRCGPKCGAVLTLGVLVGGGVVVHNLGAIAHAVSALVHARSP